MSKRFERSMVGARVIEFLQEECPDGKVPEESIFYAGYLELYIFGTGQLPGFEADKFWRVVCASLKLGTDWPLDYDHEFLFLHSESGSQYENINIAEGTLEINNKIVTVQTALLDFRLKDKRLVKKVILLHPDGRASELPNETLQ